MRRSLVALGAVLVCCVVTGSGSAHPRCTLTGTNGPDAILGTSGNDVICGLGGDDQLFGLNGDDILIGGPGNDYLDGGAGSDTLLGGPGNDNIRAFDGARDVVNGGLGVDHAWTDMFDATTNVERHN